ITNTSPSPITVGPPRCGRRACRSGDRAVSARLPKRPRRALARAASLITSSSWRCGSAPARRSAGRSGSAKQGSPPSGLGGSSAGPARDAQQWESQPLGPFLGKSLGSTVSPGVVTAEALAPFRVAQPPRPVGDPRPLPYLWDDTDQKEGAFDIALEALLMTEGLHAKGLPPHRMSTSNTTDLYWTVAQMIAHHSSNGCNLAAGDLFGTGTISGPTAEGYGSLMELSADGRRRITLPAGETRTFLEDGDEVIFRAHCRRSGFVPIGFGECRARIV